MSGISEAVCARVRQRAGNRCGYCRCPQHLVFGWLALPALPSLQSWLRAPALRAVGRHHLAGSFHPGPSIAHLGIFACSFSAASFVTFVRRSSKAKS
jgi:hypothetical protein